MVVVSILMILMTIVFVAVQGSLAEARQRQADALCLAVQSALTAYYAQYDEWPEPLGSWVKNDSCPSRNNNRGAGGATDESMIELNGEEVRKMVKVIVDEAKKGNPLMDISALYVSRDPGETGKGYGVDFMSAVHGSSRSKKKMSTNEMYFGFPMSNGRFHRFYITYSVPGDSVSVLQSDK